jgi:glycosyltransferase involved in cell wall biosynthesis
MPALRLDISPTLINRTAIYHIICDTAHTLCASREIQFSICGRDVGWDVLRSGNSELARYLLDCLGAPDRIDVVPRRDDGIPRVYFDPLYVLFVDRLLEIDAVAVLDITPLTNPYWHEPSVAALYRSAFRKLVRSPARIMSISEHTKHGLCANFPLTLNDVKVVRLYPMQTPLTKELEAVSALQGKQFLLFVGSLETRKNVSGLVRAFEASGLADNGYHLAIAGGDGKGASEIKATAANVSNVHLLGFVPAAQLAWLYRHADWFVYPSYLEGFGVPVLEAMQAGLPVVCSTTGAVPEVVGNAGLFFDPYNHEEICDTLTKLATISEAKRTSLAARSAARSTMFSFEQYMTDFHHAIALEQCSEG